MLAFGDGILTRDQVRTVAAYVQSLSGVGDPDRIATGASFLPRTAPAATASEATATEPGAPNLTDDFWIYGGDAARCSRPSTTAGKAGCRTWKVG